MTRQVLFKKGVFFGFNKIKILLHKKRLILTSQMLFMILLLHKKMTRQNYQKAYVLTPGIFHFVQLLSQILSLKYAAFIKHIFNSYLGVSNWIWFHVKKVIHWEFFSQNSLYTLLIVCYLCHLSWIAHFYWYYDILYSLYSDYIIWFIYYRVLFDLIHFFSCCCFCIYRGQKNWFQNM